MPLRGVFITGTDTGVGKTYVAAQVLRILRQRGVRVGAYKPAVSGCEDSPDGPVWNDLIRLRDALAEDVPFERICPQRFRAPLAPPVAARLEGRRVDEALLRSGIDWWRDRADFLVVEGAGGLLSPLTETESVAEVAASFRMPLLIVARSTLGTINHTLLTIEAAENRGLSVAGVILNQAVPADPADFSVQTNRDELGRRCHVPILANLPYAPATGLLRESPLFTIDWIALTSEIVRK